MATGRPFYMSIASEALWYCVKTRTRLEQTAKRGLQIDVGIEVFCPLLRFERARASGRIRVVEAMFPGYIFARFPYAELHRRVAATNGVSTVVSFGGIPSVVGESIIQELRSVIADGETVEIPSSIRVGGEVQVVEGPFKGIRAVVTQVMPARARVTVLLELLGMEREVEVNEQSVMHDVSHPMAAQ